MSGQPNIKPTDASKFREQYLAELALQAANDDKNLQANKIYKKTGQSPSIVLDTRTSAEKLADKQRLKIEIRSGLSEIMDGATSERVVQEMDDDALEFLAQRLPEIVSILKPKYKYGVPLVNFMTFMMEYIKSTRETGDYLAGNQAASGKQVLMGIRQILGEMINRETLGQVADALDRNITGANIQIGNAIRRDLTLLASVIPTRDELEREISAGNAILSREIQKQLSEALEELPTTDQIKNLLNMLNRTSSLRDSKHQEEILLRLHELLVMKPEVLQQIQLIRNEIGESQRESGRQITELKKFVGEQLAQNDELSKGRTRTALSQLTDLITRQLREQLTLRDLSDEEMRIFIEQKLAEQTKGLQADTDKRREEEAQLRRMSETLTPEQKIRLAETKRTPTQLLKIADKKAYIQEQIKLVKGQQTQKEIFNDVVGVEGIAGMSKEMLDKVIDEINKRIDILASAYSRPLNPLSASGNGLRKGRGIKGGNIVDMIGVVPTPKLVPFGRYFINARTLGKDIIAIKRPSGQGINEYPSKKVSRDLANVMRTIVGGGQPEFSHMEKLSDEEKIYLKNLVKKVDIEDRLKLIAPSKDDDEKDTHSFEVMKGEILSGNDSVDLVKKFKILILKMMRKEMLPKTQAKELLLDLATLGY